MPGANHIREGVVVRPIEEVLDPKVGRLILKYLGDDYVESKNQIRILLAVSICAVWPAILTSNDHP